MNGQKCLVAGAGISGLAAAALLEKMNAEVVLFDGGSSATEEEMYRKLPAGSKAVCYAVRLPESVMAELSLAVLSPGIPLDSELALGLKRCGVRIIGEIELGYTQEKGRLAAITGTNGKTTTTTLVGEIMKAYAGAEKVFVVGNIGRPYTMEAVNSRRDTVSVGELSSFQLETIADFRPQVSAILNITPDHLDRHHTMAEYCRAKERIAMNQTMEDICVLNYDNPYTREFGSRCLARVVWFSLTEAVAEGYYLQGDHIISSHQGQQSAVMDIRRDMKLAGRCNVENVMAALAITAGLGVPNEQAVAVIREFKAVPHRIEFVAEKGGVEYYNDSKGTNPDAAIQGILAMNRPTVLIAGGFDKQSEYDEWLEQGKDRIKSLVLIGQTREKIAACARRHGISDIYLEERFEDCLARAVSLTEPGDAVLLSPACASWGMFPNYEIRGQRFKDYVEGLEE